MEWKEYNICQLCDTISETYKGKSNSVVLINTSDVLEGKVLNHKRVPNKGLKGQFKKTFKKNDILYSEIRPANKRFAYINFSPNDYIASTKLMVLRSKPIVSSYFLFQILKSEIVLKNLQMLAESRSGTFPQITYSELSNVRVKVPPLPVQDKIVGILSALDSKIENNNKINANLEAQAQALFKSWFVDFTPFKDQPFVDSELGPIPQGWKVGKLGDICTFKRGKNLLSKNAIDEGVPVVAGGLSPSCYHNQANTSAPVVTVSGSGANAGFMRMYHVDVWASDCSFIDVSCDYLYFVYCFLSVNRRLLKHAQTGAVQPHVKPADIHDFDVVIPEEDIVKAFQSIIKELLTKVGVNEKENQRLAALRDTLLPKLMSGEIKL
ncbi:MAG: restriction endonuclease subunit S [Sodaliphilus sp.]|nr:restriction endonuclease subunit S [Sodaliphilus sp.]